MVWHNNNPILLKNNNQRQKKFFEAQKTSKKSFILFIYITSLNALSRVLNAKIILAITFKHY